MVATLVSLSTYFCSFHNTSAYKYPHIIRILYIEKAHWTKKDMSDGGHKGHFANFNQWPVGIAYHN